LTSFYHTLLLFYNFTFFCLTSKIIFTAIKKQYNTIVTSASRSGQNLIKYGPGNTKKDALKCVIKLFMLSSEFHATSLNTYTKTLRPNPVLVASSGEYSKAKRASIAQWKAL